MIKLIFSLSFSFWQALLVQSQTKRIVLDRGEIADATPKPQNREDRQIQSDRDAGISRLDTSQRGLGDESPLAAMLEVENLRFFRAAEMSAPSLRNARI